MDESLKRRLVGATVIMSVIVIFVPMLVDDGKQDSKTEETGSVPEQPAEMIQQKAFRDGPKAVEKIEPVATPIPPVLPLSSSNADDVVVNTTDVGSSQEQSAVPSDTESRAEPIVASEPAPAVDASSPASQDETSQEPGGLQAWVVQVASFTNPKFADSLVDDLRSRKFAAFKEEVPTGGRLWYRVVVGPEADKRRAKALQEEVVRSTGDERLRGAVKSYP